MYNQDFIDIMDKINSLAKSINYTNGIAWAKAATENNRLNTYDYSAFDGCHHLRNLMAHGFARDIIISNETMQIARMFHLSIRNDQVNTTAAMQAFPAKSALVQEEERQRKLELTVREGDYIIAFKRENDFWFRDSFRLLGTMFKVVNINGMRRFMTVPAPKYHSYGYGLSYLYKNYVSFFVVRSNAFGDRGYYFIDEPDIYKNDNGQCLLRIKYTPDRDTKPDSLDTIGYLAHPDCFLEDNPRLLYAMGPESPDEYLKPTASDRWCKLPEDFSLDEPEF